MDFMIGFIFAAGISSVVGPCPKFIVGLLILIALAFHYFGGI